MKSRAQRRGKILARYFFPNPENGDHPHLLRSGAIYATLAFALVVQVGFFAYQTTIRSGGANIAAVLPGAITLFTNEARAETSSAPLSVNPLLAEAAQKKAEDMATQGYFAHREPNGEMSWYRFKEAGYDYVYAGENLAVNIPRFMSLKITPSIKRKSELWINSATLELLNCPK